MKAAIFVILSLGVLVLPLIHTSSDGGVARGYVSGPSGSTDFPWTMFRNNAMRTGVTPASGPARGSLMWSFSTTALIYSSAVVADGTIFIPSWDGNVYAIDEYSGLQKWVFSTYQYVPSSPAVSNGLVYITTACPTAGSGPFTCTSGSVYALDEQTGSVVWQKVQGSPITSSPLVADGKVFYGTVTLGNGQVYARYAASGNGNWTVYLSDAVESSPSVDNGRVFVGQVDGAVVALNETSGAQIWRVVPSGATIQTAPAVGYGKVFVGTVSTGLFALNENTGATIWTFPTGGFNSTSVALNGGEVYFGTGRGRVFGLNATTGAQIWSRTVGGGVSSSPSLALGSKTLFVGSNDHNLYALNATTGAVLWTYLTGSAVSSSPAIADGRVFFGSQDHKVYALGAVLPRLQTSIIPSPTILKPDMVSVLTVTVANGTTPVSGANLTFTSSAGGSFTQPLMMSPGTYVSNFTAPSVSSTTNTTLQVVPSKSGYLSGSAQTTVTLNPLRTLTVNVVPRPNTVPPGGNILLAIQVANSTELVSGATIVLSSSSGGSFSPPTDGGNGNYTAFYNAPLQSSSIMITVQASKSGFSSGQGQITVSVNGIPDLNSNIAGIPFYLLLGSLFLIVLLIVVMFLSRRKAPPRLEPNKDSPLY